MKHEQKGTSKMQEQLSNIRGKVPQGQRPMFRPVRSPMFWQEEGVDHINVGEGSTTRLGQLLSHRFNFDFTHSFFGHFKNLEQFEVYILSEEKDDRIRKLTGQPLKKFANSMTKISVPNFKVIFLLAYYERIKAQKELVHLMSHSKLPFDLYYILRDSKLRVRPNRALWLTEGLEEIRLALKEERQPNFKKYMDNKTIAMEDIYEHVFLTNGASSEKKVPYEKPKKVKKPKNTSTKVENPGEQSAEEKETENSTDEDSPESQSSVVEVPMTTSVTLEVTKTSESLNSDDLALATANNV